MWRLVAKSLLREECGEVIGLVFDSLRKNGYLTDDLPDEKKDKLVMVAGGALLKGYMGDIKILQGDGRRELENARETESVYNEYVLDAREDEVLKIAYGAPGVSHVFVYGAGHTFGGGKSFKHYDSTGRRSSRDNIDRWNSEHPEKKFSLIEIFPEHLPEDYGVSD